MASLDSLPTELILKIAKALIGPSEDPGTNHLWTADPRDDLAGELKRTASLTPLLAVNRRLRNICGSYAWRALDLRGMSLEQLQHFDTSVEIWRAWTVVHIIADHESMWYLERGDAATDQGDDDISAEPRPKPDAMARIISFCPHLERLTILSSGLRPEYYNVLSSLEDAPYSSGLKGVRALNLFDNSVGFTDANVAELIEHLFQLEELCIDITDSDFGDSFGYGDIRYALSQHTKLKNLKLRTFNWPGDAFNPDSLERLEDCQVPIGSLEPWLAPVRMFTWMMVQPADEKPGPDCSMLPHIAQFRHTLREVTLAVEDFDDFKYVHFPNLERLELTFHSVVNEHLHDSDAAGHPLLSFTSSQLLRDIRVSPLLPVRPLFERLEGEPIIWPELRTFVYAKLPDIDQPPFGSFEDFERVLRVGRAVTIMSHLHAKSSEVIIG